MDCYNANLTDSPGGICMDCYGADLSDSEGSPVN